MTCISHIKNTRKYLGLFLETYLKIHTSDRLTKYKNQHLILKKESTKNQINLLKEYISYFN